MLVDIITSDQSELRDSSVDAVCRQLSEQQLLQECRQLDEFRRECDNLYERVRSLLFLYSIHRFHLPRHLNNRPEGRIPYRGYEHLLNRRFSEAIDSFLTVQNQSGCSSTLSSALAEGYYRLGFQTLSDQVRQSVRTVRGNQWMFRTGHPLELPLRIHPVLRRPVTDSFGFPVLRERTAVRMDFSHSGWSDIFFLGMDFPDGAGVINASVNLAVRGKHGQPEPPIDCSLRVIDEPILRLVSIDLDAKAEITEINEVFDFARDYLGLLKGAVIASGLVPPGLEGCGGQISVLLNQLVGPGMGLEIVSRVNDIPKGSRLAVSTNLLGSLISLCMRATGQVSSLTGELQESDRRIVAARAILGEWIGGSGGGWQDSGGIWPGIKLITGRRADTSDPEYGISRGRLLPEYHVFSHTEVTPETRQRLQDSLVLVHGGMAQNVGPILEMVTEKYLLRCEDEWAARKDAISILHEISDTLQAGDLQATGRATHRNFHEPLQKIIPWCSNAYTEELISQCRSTWGDQFHGFWMLGGMAGGGMGFIFDPAIRQQAQDWLQSMMIQVKRSMESSMPFAMDPVVYDFSINDQGTFAELRQDGDLPAGYHSLMVPGWLKREVRTLSPMVRKELERIGNECRDSGSSSELASQLISRILPTTTADHKSTETLETLLSENGFDPVAHEQIREEILSGRLGLSQNRLPNTARIEDVPLSELLDARVSVPHEIRALGEKALAEGQVAIVTLAAGIGSRWTQGAGVVKALNPFCRMKGQFRSFLDIHLAKSRQIERLFGKLPQHVITTGYLTDGPIRTSLTRRQDCENVRLSRSASVGLRMVPGIRDLQFAWEEVTQQVLDQQKEKMRSSVRAALVNWARTAGECSDYRDNLPFQCMHPVGHWYEFPNMLRNGTLRAMLDESPQLQWLMMHNIDTLGASADPGCLGLHIHSGADLSFEVMSRRLEDRGGGLARVDGRIRLVEGLAMPREEDEFRLSWYNTLTTWIHIDQTLSRFGLTRENLQDNARVETAIREFGRRMPTYITLKDVKKRWGNGQEDIFPVSQFEKLWGDMSAISDVRSSFIAVSSVRGRQLKDPAQLDGWLRDGTAGAVEALCDW
jgi:hypothetical protein